LRVEGKLKIGGAIMNMQALLPEPGRIDEPGAAKEYSEVFTQVASDHRPVIVRRNGADLAAVIPLEHLEMLQDLLARQEAERVASHVNWDRLVRNSPPPQLWFDGDEPKPF
jgi:PHD/YefM family antitoxin component YafN of YafNO toxin-antitoxin module